MASHLPRTIIEAHKGLVNRTYTALELLRRFQERITAEEPRIHAFLNVSPELARAQALEVDRKIAGGKEIGMLEGVPCAVKDNILIEGEPCTAASKMLEHYRAAYDATVITKLKGLGAVMVGKTNLDEFAMGSSTENSAFGPTKNPHDETRVPGGSSGGSAAAVSAGEALYALGSDTGGSVRQPAGFCGVVGLKPTYGSVSRNGLIAMVSSLDVIGPIANTVEDAEIVFDAIRGKDPLDATSSDGKAQMAKRKAQKEDRGVEGLRLGLPKEYFIEGVEPEVRQAVQETARVYEQLGAVVSEVSLPHSRYALPTYYILVFAEVSANLARYDGIRYGIKNQESGIREGLGLLETYLENRALFGAEAKRRIMLGTFVLSHGYYDAYYKKALGVRARIRKDFEEVFENVDALLTPTSPTLPFRLGEKTTDPLQMYLEDVFTVPINLAGVPALSLNCGWAEREGKRLPIGAQLIAPWFGESTLFTLGEALEHIQGLSPQSRTLNS
jgi:aspartyl-tRNA(Asn)/glutamyl-tRNA(Gln) amidotransferase subunit A